MKAGRDAVRILAAGGLIERLDKNNLTLSV
jgi:hypothetical protein